MENNYGFGNYIYNLRTAKELSQAEVAEKLGVTNKAVSKWETGAAYPSTKLIYPLSQILGVSIEEMFLAISNDKRPKTRLRSLLDRFFSNKYLTFYCPLTLSVILYILFLLFRASGFNTVLIVLTPFSCVLISAMIRLVYYVNRKIPMCPPSIVDVITAFMAVIAIIGSVTVSFQFLSDIHYGFSPMCCGCPVILCTAHLCHNKRNIH